MVVFWYFNKRKKTGNSSYNYECKIHQQNTSKQNSATGSEDYYIQVSGKKLFPECKDGSPYENTSMQCMS